jgi:hypothetical protein
MGGFAMTRRSIPTVLASLLVALLITVNIPTVNADSAPILDKSVCTHPIIGFPTCYTQQADGTWVREELMDLDTGWVEVGTVTAAEVADAVGDANATAFHVASIGSPVAVQSIDYHVIDTSAPYMEDFTPATGQNR